MFCFLDNCVRIGCNKFSLLRREHLSQAESYCHLSGSRKNLIKGLCFRFQQCLVHFIMLTVEVCSEAGLFRHLGNESFAVSNLGNT